ncbi:prepilin-type N-terminal cleavage/methylation domain-containing protein [Granulicatella sp. zg-ZJ]|uniref:competence type IV pilus minor pilin ComGF n=1 Tax=Granulicatella sp. zg-ZJ TaxID=2678504 RepID=UPI0013F95718|nr:prepilin-type N-terminal cleavage/methylation domain-containing protein [Granulicatella sp. zg-ZJ]
MAELFIMIINKYYQFLKNKKGFTLLETVVSLFVFCVITILLLSTQPMITKYHGYMRQHHETAFIQFKNYLEYCLSKEQYIKHDTNVLFTQIDKKTIRYEQYHNILRRTTDKGGYEPLLFNVQKWYVNKQKDYYHIRVFFQNGDYYETNILYIIQK